TMCGTSSTCTAYSIAAPTERLWTSPGSKRGTMLAMLRSTKSSPGSALTIRLGTTRESQQPMNIAMGRWPPRASPSNSSRSCSKSAARNFRCPWTSRVTMSARVPRLDARVRPDGGVERVEPGAPLPDVGRDVLDLAADERPGHDEELEVGDVEL